jgi:hypothetical protein
MGPPEGRPSGQRYAYACLTRSRAAAALRSHASASFSACGHREADSTANASRGLLARFSLLEGWVGRSRSRLSGLGLSTARFWRFIRAVVTPRRRRMQGKSRLALVVPTGEKRAVATGRRPNAAYRKRGAF